MSTLAEDKTDLQNAETALKALYSAPDIDLSTAGGGRVSIRRAAQIAMLERRIRKLKIQIRVKGGDLEGATAAVQGVDTEHASDNGDWF